MIDTTEIIDITYTGAGESNRVWRQTWLNNLRSERTFYENRQQRIRFTCEVCKRVTVQKLRSSLNLNCFTCNREIKDFGNMATKRSRNIYRRKDGQLHGNDDSD